MALLLPNTTLFRSLLDVLDGDEADAAIILVDHEQLFDPALVEQTARILLRDSRLHRRQIVAGHQFRDGLAHLFGKADVAVGEDAHQLARQRSEEHTSELQSLMRISYAVLCLK